MESIRIQNTAYIHIRYVDGGYRVTGTPTYLRGRVLNDAAKDQCGLDGLFVKWRWDGQRLEVISSPYGFAPVYYYATPTEICVSTSILSILDCGAPRELDRPALALFLRLGFYVGTDTPFAHIKAIPRSGSLTWSACTSVRADNSRLDPAPAPIRRDEAIEKYASLFSEAMRRLAPRSDDFAVPLSGGRDSRHILLELLRQGFQPKFCLTTQRTPPIGNEDIRIASELTKALHLKHIVVEWPKWRLRYDELTNQMTSFCTDEEACFMPLLPPLEQVQEVYDGIAGGVLSAGDYLDPDALRSFQDGRLEEAAKRIMDFWHHETSWFRTALSSSILKACPYSLAMERLVQELREFSLSHNPLTAFYFWNRTRREISLYTFSMLSNYTDPLCPYLDQELLRFLLSSPAELILDHQFHTDTIHSAFPAYRNIPFGGREESSRSDGTYWNRLSIELACYLLRHLRSRFVNCPRLIPSILRHALRGRAPTIHRRKPFRIQYLIQLEELLRNYGDDPVLQLY